MSSPRSWPWFAAALAASCTLAPHDEEARPLPAPRGSTPALAALDPLARDEEAWNHERKAWIERRHWAPPDVDWTAVERANGEREVQRRSQLAALPASASPWIERGSSNQSGRVVCAARSTDGTLLYAGADSGGVWRATLAGAGWTPLGDNLYGGVHWLGILPPDVVGGPDVIVAASDGGLFHVSRDDGASWVVPATLPSCNSLRRIAVTTNGAWTCFVLGSFKDGATYKYSLWRSTDRALTFQKMATLSPASYYGDLWVPRNGASDVYLLDGGQVKKSTDNGASFTAQGTVAAGSAGGELAGSEAGAPRFWAVLDVGGATKLYRSDDAGLSWTYKSDPGDYYGTLNASIVNSNLVAYGGVNCSKSTNGGDSFTLVNDWSQYYSAPATKLHADLFGIEVWRDTATTETWYPCTDGGVYKSAALSSVANLSLAGLNISQYYSTHTSTADVDNVSAGAQDQGYQTTTQPPTGGGTTLAFTQVISGDYGHLTSGDGTHAYVYSTYPGFILVQIGESGTATAAADFPAGESHDWMPTVVADPLDKTRFFFLATKLYRYTKGAGNSWSPAQWSTKNFAVSGGEYLTGLDFSPVDGNKAYAVTNFGRLYWSNDHGVTWTLGSGSAPGGQYFYGTALLADRSNPGTAYVGGSGYSGPAVLRTVDGGLTWSSWSTGLPSTLAYCLGQSPSGDVYVGTETGAYRRAPAGSSWNQISDATAPLCVYWSVENVPGTSSMRFATYARGIWDYVESGTSPCGGYASYGVALGGANLLAMVGPAASNIGTTHAFDVFGAKPFAPGFVIAGFAQASIPLLGGTLAVDPSAYVLFNVVAAADGALSFDLSVPYDVNLAGHAIDLQSLLVDFSMPLGWTLSNGVEGVLCQ